MLAAIAPLPENVPELMLASLLAGERLPVVDGLGPHRLIGNAEFALIGSVAPHVRRPEGPFGDHYGLLLAGPRLSGADRRADRAPA